MQSRVNEEMAHICIVSTICHASECCPDWLCGMVWYDAGTAIPSPAATLSMAGAARVASACLALLLALQVLY